MKIVSTDQYYETKCPVCRAVYRLEWPADVEQVSIVGDAPTNRTFLCSWHCPVCKSPTATEANKLPWKWAADLAKKAGGVPAP